VTALPEIRPLTEDEKWAPPQYNRILGVAIRVRVICQAPPTGRCVAGATVKFGRRKLCRTHLRMALKERL
jgi:hypothetical protein